MNVIYRDNSQNFVKNYEKEDFRKLEKGNPSCLLKQLGLSTGAPGRIRTRDPLVRSQVLYPTELPARRRTVILMIFFKNANTQFKLVRKFLKLFNGLIFVNFYFHLISMTYKNITPQTVNSYFFFDLKPTNQKYLSKRNFRFSKISPLLTKHPPMPNERIRGKNKLLGEFP